MMPTKMCTCRRAHPDALLSSKCSHNHITAQELECHDARPSPGPYQTPPCMTSSEWQSPVQGGGPALRQAVRQRSRAAVRAPFRKAEPGPAGESVVSSDRSPGGPAGTRCGEKLCDPTSPTACCGCHATPKSGLQVWFGQITFPVRAGACPCTFSNQRKFPRAELGVAGSDRSAGPGAGRAGGID